MKIISQWISLVLALVALVVSILAYQQARSVASSDQAAAAAIERLRADIAKEQAQQKAAAAQNAEALKQGLGQDLKKFQELSNVQPLGWDGKPLTSPPSTGTPSPKK
jgi:uncharacterized protein (UPF0333 family)